MRSHTLYFVLAVMIGFAPAAYGQNNASSNVSQLPEPLEHKVQSLQADLEAKGYEVARGFGLDHFGDLFTKEDCQFTIAIIGNCRGNNPASPYIVPSVPLWPDEFVDEHIKDLFGPKPDDTQVDFRLDERKAVVVLAQLPPPAKYFGLHTYVSIGSSSLRVSSRREVARNSIVRQSFRGREHLRRRSRGDRVGVLQDGRQRRSVLRPVLRARLQGALALL